MLVPMLDSEQLGLNDFAHVCFVAQSYVELPVGVVAILGIFTTFCKHQVLEFAKSTETNVVMQLDTGYEIQRQSYITGRYALEDIAMEIPTLNLASRLNTLHYTRTAAQGVSKDVMDF